MITDFLSIFRHYLIEILPVLAIGFFISGIIHEFVPTNLVEKYLGDKGIKPILLATITGTILPVCCLGSLPIAVSLYKKGARLGPVLAFLIATPATSISALLVTWRLLGIGFSVFIFFAVIVMGLLIGIIGNSFSFNPRTVEEENCPHCSSETECCACSKKCLEKFKSILKYSFIDMPKEIGLEMLVGLVLAALVATVVPVGILIKNYLGGGFGYIFSLIFGLIMYICSTATVPLVDAFIMQGMNVGAGMVLLLAGPVTSYGTILVLRKEFGAKILFVYLSLISILSLALGFIYSIV